MRRLPIYFLIDSSESMVGTPIAQVQEGLRTVIQTLRVDPYALETVFVSVIAFAGKAKVLSPLEELYKFYPPELPIGGGTSLGKGLECLMNELDRNIQKTTAEKKGDWKPVIFLFTDGNPTDNYSGAFKRWNEKYRGHCSLIAVSIGDNVDILTLAQITNDILVLKETDAESFSKFFKWISASIQAASLSASDGKEEDMKLAPSSDSNLEKVNPEKAEVRVDDNFVVIHGRCQTTKDDYLIKYIRMGKGHAKEESGAAYTLLGAYTIDKESYESLSAGGSVKINTRKLRGVPTCPCCGNTTAAVLCSCGKIFCASGAGEVVCPWCGAKGYLSEGNGEDGGTDINRGLG